MLAACVAAAANAIVVELVRHTRVAQARFAAVVLPALALLGAHVAAVVLPALALLVAHVAAVALPALALLVAHVAAVVLPALALLVADVAAVVLPALALLVALPVLHVLVTLHVACLLAAAAAWRLVAHADRVQQVLTATAAAVALRSIPNCCCAFQAYSADMSDIARCFSGGANKKTL